MKIVFILILIFILPVTVYVFPQEKPDGNYLYWEKGFIKVKGSSKIIHRTTGNIIEWQYDAAVQAKRNLLQNFVVSLNKIRVDAYHTAGDILIKNRDRNEHLYRYIDSKKITDIFYTDNLVEISINLPFFGENGFFNILVTPGIDPGNFPNYEVYTYSTEFTGLVIDCRGLGRVPAIAPRIFDEKHNLVYSVDYIEEDFFKKWGAVKYTDDPYYSGFEQRVGSNPFRIVAIENPKLINTDIAISTVDSRILLQNENTRKKLQEGRVIIVIEEVVQKISFSSPDIKNYE